MSSTTEEKPNRKKKLNLFLFLFPSSRPHKQNNPDAQATTSFAHDPTSQYLVTTSVTTTTAGEESPVLRVTAERVSDSRAWAASFGAGALEALTAAAGARRSFKEVVRLVRASLAPVEKNRSGGGGGASSDLLTSEDVGGGNNGAAPPPAAEKQSSPPSAAAAFPSLTAHHNKRYLVVSLSTEFDSAVYPLPLLAEPDAAAAARLRPLVAKLRRSVAASQLASRDLPLELSRLRGEVDALRQALDESEASAQAQAARAEEAERELARERAARRRALRAAAADLEESKAQAGSARAEVHAARLRCRALAGEVDELRRRMTGGGGGRRAAERENVAPARCFAATPLAPKQQQQKLQEHSPSTPSSTTSTTSSPSPLARARALAAAGGASEASRAPPLYSPPPPPLSSTAAAGAGAATAEKLDGGSFNSFPDPGAEVEARLGALRAFIDGARASRR